FNQHNIPGDPSVIPPVGIDRGDFILFPDIIHHQYYKIITVVEFSGDIELEGGKTTLVNSQFFSVEIYMTLIIYRPEVKQVAFIVLRGNDKIPFIPQRAFIKRKFFLL